VLRILSAKLNVSFYCLVSGLIEYVNPVTTGILVKSANGKQEFFGRLTEFYSQSQRLTTSQTRRCFANEQHVHFKSSRLNRRIDIRDLQFIFFSSYRHGGMQPLRYTRQVNFIDRHTYLVASYYVDLTEALTGSHHLSNFKLRARHLPIDRCANDQVIQNLPYPFQAFLHPLFGCVQCAQLTYPGD